MGIWKMVHATCKDYIEIIKPIIHHKSLKYIKKEYREFWAFILCGIEMVEILIVRPVALYLCENVLFLSPFIL